MVEEVLSLEVNILVGNLDEPGIDPNTRRFGDSTRLNGQKKVSRLLVSKSRGDGREF